MKKIMLRLISICLIFAILCPAMAEEMDDDGFDRDWICPVCGALLNAQDGFSADLDRAISPEMWAALIEKYSDRVMIGSDVVGHWSTYPQEICKYYLLLEKLKPETVKKICRRNILSLIKRW